MCCFSGNVSFVSNTRIFARAEDSIRQFVVYQMAFGAKEDLAMILPLPVRQGSGEDAVRFIDLSGYKEFFSDLQSGFPRPAAIAPAPAPIKPAAIPPTIKVQAVGNYEASFVPTAADFKRLDKRFRLADNVWKKLPGYENHGFAVFKLKSGEHESHPMAFSFPRRQVGSLFFPTVHIHDGEVHPKADFDHLLYCQPSVNAKLALKNWLETPSLAKNFMDMKKSKGVMDATQHCYRLSMHGNLNNTDVYVRAA
jgi:hypothetical protein